MLEENHAFEAFFHDHNVTVKHCYANDGRFCNNMFITNIYKQGQSISYCGVGAHHQNRIAENRIRDLTESAKEIIYM